MKAMILAGGLPQIELIKQLKAREVYTILVDGAKKPIALPYADKFYQVDIFDIESVKNIAIEEKVDFLITCCADQVLLVVAQVSEMLGLPWYIDYKTACEVSDKRFMKKKFIENSIPTSKYIELEELDFQKISNLKFPLVVKPVDAYSSKGVRKALNEEELVIFFAEAKQISRTGGVIVEEFCQGEEVSVDVYVENGKAHVLCISNSEKIKDNGRFVIYRGCCPAKVEENIKLKIEEVAQRIAESFGLINSPMLIQLINTGKDISVLEFCARTGGNMKYIMIKYASGFDVIKSVIDLCMGTKPTVSTEESKHKYIVNDFIYCNPGVYDHLEGFEELYNTGIVAEYFSLRPQGTVVKGISSSSDRIAGFTIVADDINEFNCKHREVVEKVKVIDVNGEDIMRHDLLPDLER